MSVYHLYVAFDTSCGAAGRDVLALVLLCARRVVPRYTRRSIAETKFEDASGFRACCCPRRAQPARRRPHAPSSQRRPIRNPYSLFARNVAFVDGWLRIDRPSQATLLLDCLSLKQRQRCNYHRPRRAQRQRFVKGCSRAAIAQCHARARPAAVSPRQELERKSSDASLV